MLKAFLFGVGVVLAAAFTLAIKKRIDESKANPPSPDPPPAAVAVAAVAPAARPPVAPDPPLVNDYSAALGRMLGRMTDSVDEFPDATVNFAKWAAMNMTLADVQVAKNETSLKKVLKDSDAERGRRLCLRGSVTQIEKVNTGTGAIFGGLLRTGDWDMVSFMAARSTGELVEGSRARFCGVVTGRYSYSNAGGGTTHAVHLVGVFDLPENRPPGERVHRGGRKLECVPPNDYYPPEYFNARRLAEMGLRRCNE